MKRVWVLAVVVTLLGCGQEQAGDWQPTQLPEPAISAMKKHLGEERFSFLVSPPNDQTRSLNWLCGLVTTERKQSRFFVYSQSDETLTLAPVVGDQMTQDQAMDMMAFMEMKRPCDG